MAAAAAAAAIRTTREKLTRVLLAHPTMHTSPRVLGWAGQKADEFFESVSVLLLFYSLSLGHKENESDGASLAFILAHSFILLLGVCFIPVAFCEIHLITMVLLTVFRFYHALNDLRSAGVDRARSRRIERSVKLAIVFTGVGFVAWLIDFFFCNDATQPLNLVCVITCFLSVLLVTLISPLPARLRLAPVYSSGTVFCWRRNCKRPPYSKQG